MKRLLAVGWNAALWPLNWLADHARYLPRIVSIAWPMTGIALIGSGAWMIYRPAGLISVGALMILDYLHSTRPRNRK